MCKKSGESSRTSHLQASAETFQRCLGQCASHEDAARDVAFAKLVAATADDLERILQGWGRLENGNCDAVEAGGID